ncbi:MAG: hypothetical protein GXX96_33555 [Planctomycetaceae bacterium]|nr:hypothetical protein [Planctomycetaceae bacterium]
MDKTWVWVGIAAIMGLLEAVDAAEPPVGARPYEMDWAGRIEDPRPALVDFEKLDDWTITGNHSVATLETSREQQLWGRYVGKLIYRADGGGPVVTLRPPQSLPIPAGADCVTLWVYGNNWAYSADPSTPQVSITVVLRSADGQTTRVDMGRVRWKEWFLMHRRLTPEQIELLGQGAALDSIEVGGGYNREDRTIYLDNLAVYREEFKPLQFEPRPRHGVEPFEGQSTGVNTGPGRLPFPNREETILPDNATADFRVRTEQDGGEYRFCYEGPDAKLTYVYRPAKGDLGDIEVIVPDGLRFRPMVDGGFRFQAAGEDAPVAAQKAELLDCRLADNVVAARWRYRWGDQTAEGILRLRLWQKSLVVDFECLGGVVGEVRTGRAVGLKQTELVTIPFLTCGSMRPAVVVSTDGPKPMFLMGLFDHFRTNASEFFAVNEINESGVTYHGGTRYHPLWDPESRLQNGRNDCFERLFLTVAPTFEEVLPNMPNPKSPWMEVTGSRVWRAHGASDRQADAAFWRRVARFGMTEIVVTDHEVGWRDGGESFTLRTRAAPGKGGDEGQAEYSRIMRGLGLRYGIYNNYRDFAPVNEHWDPHGVVRESDGQLQPAWARCYVLKPTRAVELESHLSPIIQQKFQLDTAYCDVHTAVTPWSSVDYDARVPGAGRMADVIYAYGEIMLHQKQAWNGPVYSEGNNHWYYCGLTDGNYGQDQAARLTENPWLVDFDLQKLHPLCCNFGMGNPGMFFGRTGMRKITSADWPAKLDQFLAATLAFGHTGFFVREAGEAESLRSYFSVQQIHQRYAVDTVESIHYADAGGNLLDTSTALAGGDFRRSQIRTRYRGGMEVWVNGHPEYSWKIHPGDRPQDSPVVLPPFGWYACDTQKKDLVGLSAIVDGRRADYVDGPKYTYANGRGRFTRFERAACDGHLIAHRREDGKVELIPVLCQVGFGIGLDGRRADAVALNEAGETIGPAETRLSRGLVFVEPVEGAFSYLLTPEAAPAMPAASAPSTAIPGETIQIQGAGNPTVLIPADTPVGRLFWHRVGDDWLDFLVVPLVDVTAQLQAGGLAVELVPHVNRSTDASIELLGKMEHRRLVPEEALTISRDLEAPGREDVQPVELRIEAGPLVYRKTWWLKTEEQIAEAAAWPAFARFGQRMRGKEESGDFGQTNGYVRHEDQLTCGGSDREGWSMHPPYVGGTGYVFALTDPIELPRVPAVFQCEIGKGDGSDVGDGILFQVNVVEADGMETLAGERVWDKHAWDPWSVDLARWAGKTVQLKLIADVGKKDNSSGDWARWASLRLQTAVPVPVRTLHDKPVELTHVDGPHMPEQVDVKLLRGAVSGKLRFQGIGLQGSEPYISHGTLNGVAIGPLPSSRGVESAAAGAASNWGPDVEVPLPPEAIAALDLENTFSISNPGSDCFKIRRVWLDLTLPGGRQVSSQINTTVWTQPEEWLHAEGTLVPFGKQIEVAVRLRGKK